MDRRKFLAIDGSVGAWRSRPAAYDRARRGQAELLVAEPVHSTGYLPMYIAMAKDYFAEVRHQREDRHHRDRLRPHQRGAVGPGLRLHRRPGAQRLRQGQGRGAARRGAIASTAATSTSAPPRATNRRTPTGRPISRARRSRVGPYGGTPNSITRYLLGKWKLDAKTRRDAAGNAEFGRPRRRQEPARPRSASAPSP